MDTMLVAVFETQEQASTFATDMKHRNESGGLLVYAWALIAKKLDGISVVDLSSWQNCSDPVLASATRSLIGLLSERSFFDSVDDSMKNGIAKTANPGVDASFVDEVTRRLLPGRAAIVAEVEEENTRDLDVLLERRGGAAFRCVRREDMDDRVTRELTLLGGEIRVLKKLLLRSGQEPDPQLQQKLDLAMAKCQAAKERARQYAAGIKREAEAKIASLQACAGRTEGGTKTRLERWAEDVRVEYVNRATKLNLAWRSGSDALDA